MVVDTSAIFAFLAAEPEAEMLARRMQADPVFVSAPTWVESGIVVGNRLGLDGTRRLHALAAGLQFEIVAFDRQLAEVAVSAHARFGRGTGHRANLNLGDCFSYALARTRNLPLLFKGDDFIHTDIVPALGPV
ncbi:toxin [Pseudaminobacter manganicus]|uniref:Ribonuclease VapC n=1 Tax=Manganibacter manganicus TaxID=1873176 RepID=A0A1V8RSL4_9HYPH|nr:toxin [Pseudaminobacter manganicus]